MHLNGTGHGANLVGIPAGLLASAAFNDFPMRLHIAGTRENHAELFARLDICVDAAQGVQVFEDYMRQNFTLDVLPQTPRRFHASYSRLLCGWGFDTNSREGAVMKAWVESRFGIFPIYHKEPLDRVSSPAWSNYVEEKMSSRFHNNNIYLQLDLLYEFCQWSLWRWHGKNRHIELYRGVNLYGEDISPTKHISTGSIIRFNNLVSFSASRDIAGEFGDYVLSVNVPKVKIAFYSALLPRHPLKGENEYLVIGGDYRVAACQP